MCDFDATPQGSGSQFAFGSSSFEALPTGTALVVVFELVEDLQQYSDGFDE